MKTEGLLASPLLALALALSLPACGDDTEDDGGDTDSMNGDDDDDDDNSGDDDDDDNSGDDDDDNSGDDDDDDDDDDNSGDDDDDDDSTQCDGDWSLASVPFTGETFIGMCEGSPAMNCITGHYITFADGECWCLPECAAAGLSEGDACTDDGSITCTYIESSNGNNSGVFCVPPEWGLCGK